MKFLWLIPIVLVAYGMRKEWKRLNAPTSSSQIIKELRQEIKNRRNKQRQEWEWRHAV
jgi:hypothetical protein